MSDHIEVHLKTSSYFTYFGSGRIGISVGTPRRGFPGDLFYRALAPRRGMLDLDYDTYRAEYFGSILAPLNPGQVYEDLHRLAEGAEPVLLCFERTPFTATNWCHRRMVAEWFEGELDVHVPEIE